MLGSSQLLKVSALSQLLLGTCFLSITSKQDYGKMLIAWHSVTTVMEVDSTCGYGTSLQLKDGRKICTIEQLPQLQAQEKNCRL